MHTQWMLGIATGSLLVALSAVAQAAPASNAGGIVVSTEHASAVEKVARRCWWQDGQRYCRRVSFSYGQPRPEELHTGSSEWWRAMDREGRGGFGRR